MPRIARVIATGLPHHVTQRGNNRRKIFFSRMDRLVYLDLIRQYSKQYKASILAYCLMENHVHFIVIPQERDSLARTFNVAHMRYARHVHGKMSSSGHLWQGRFYSCVLDDNHLLAAARYAERNPVRARCAKDPWDWEWSSAAHHIGKSQSRLPLGNLFDYVGMDPKQWKEYIAEEEGKFVSEIRNYTRVGRPLGADAFVENLEGRLARKLKALPPGRPIMGGCPHLK